MVEADVEAALPEAVGGDALVGVVVGVQYRLYCQTRLPRAVTNLETLTPFIKDTVKPPSMSHGENWEEKLSCIVSIVYCMGSGLN